MTSEFLGVEEESVRESRLGWEERRHLPLGFQCFEALADEGLQRHIPSTTTGVGLCWLWSSWLVWHWLKFQQAGGDDVATYLERFTLETPQGRREIADDAARLYRAVLRHATRRLGASVGFRRVKTLYLGDGDDEEAEQERYLEVRGSILESVGDHR
jgi:hypothetical protein